MGRRIVGAVVTSVLLSAAFVAVGFVEASPASAAASAACFPDWQPGVDYGSFTGTNVNIRNGPDPQSCQVAAVGQPSHRVRFDCWVFGATVNGYSTWSHIEDETLWTTGWVSDAYLSVNAQGSRGAVVQCLNNTVAPKAKPPAR